MVNDFLAWYDTLPLASKLNERRLLLGGIIEVPFYVNRPYVYLKNVEATDDCRGTTIMIALCERADLLNVELRLEAHSYETRCRNATTDDRLVTWYEKFGFEKLQLVKHEQITCWEMRRLPNNTKFNK